MSEELKRSILLKKQTNNPPPATTQKQTSKHNNKKIYRSKTNLHNKTCYFHLAVVLGPCTVLNLSYATNFLALL